MATVQNDTATCRVGIYLRLSKEDGDKEDGDRFESNSISNQQLIIEDYLVDNPDLITIDTYADDGYTGTNFARPGFKRLIDDITAGKINCVVECNPYIGRQLMELVRELAAGKSVPPKIYSEEAVFTEDDDPETLPARPY